MSTTATSTTETTTIGSAAPRSGARVRVQKLGTALSNMVMPNIGAFIAWGLITALFIKTGWLPSLFSSLRDPAGWVARIGGWGDFDGAGIVGPMITYLLPILIGATGGRMVYGVRGGVVGAIATMGVIAGTDIPMFMGAMIMGPLGGWAMKKVDALWDGKIRPGFEMLVDNFSSGIVGLILACLGFFGIGPIVSSFSRAASHVVDFLVAHDLLPLTSIFIEPAKVLFLNNAINHGILTPLGTTQATQTGKSILFLLEANPGPGLGLLLAYMFFGKGAARASAPGAAIIQFFGGIHEIYFPYVLMKPKLIAATILGGMTGIFINVLFGSGLRAPAAPGSIIAVLAQTASDSYLGVILSVIGAAGVSFLVASLLLKTDRANDETRPGRGHRRDGSHEGQDVGGGGRPDGRRGSDQQHRVRLRCRDGVLGDGSLGAAQEDSRSGLHRRQGHQPVHRQPHRQLRVGGQPPRPHRPGPAENAVGPACVRRRLHEQPPVRRDRRACWAGSTAARPCRWPPLRWPPRRSPRRSPATTFWTRIRSC